MEWNMVVESNVDVSKGVAIIGDSVAAMQAALTLAQMGIRVEVITNSVALGWNDDFSELYRQRTDNAGIRCEACHGATHALYPAHNRFSENRDNIQPMQYSKMPLPIGTNMDCQVCHKIEMEFPIHHENMLRMFRNTRLIAGK